jgi:hypothetical protein
VVSKQERIVALERQISRSQWHIRQRERVSNRFSWTRVAVFFGGLALSIVGYIGRGWWLVLPIALVTIVVYAVLAYIHGKFERSIRDFRLWQHLKRTHLARMRLDWESIPDAYVDPIPADHPFASDLDIVGSRSLHRLINTAISREGTKRLQHWLLATVPDKDAITRRQALVRELTPLSRFRDKLTLRAILSSRRIAEQLEDERFAQWLRHGSGTSALPLLLLGSTALCLLTLILLVLNIVGVLGAWWILSLVISAALFLNTKAIRGDLFEDAYSLRDGFATLGGVFAYLEAYPYGTHIHLKKLCEPFFADSQHRPSRLLNQVSRIATAATLSQNRFLWIPLNALVPWDTYYAYLLRGYRQTLAERLPLWLDTWFELEALCSLATFAYLNPDYRLPNIAMTDEFANEAHLTVQAVGHPLLDDTQKVTNDFALQRLGEVVIITGSNMAGKSTFLRTLGINLCLAYTGGPVNAQAFSTTLFRVFTCIKVSDSVTDGYSYFYAEVRRLKALLGALGDKGYPLFFLVDEIFKGTNNRERLIGSRSYVRALAGKHCLGCISTHDLELVSLERTLPNVENYHFREEVVNGTMVFDYRLRSGPSPTTNALKIMQLEGLPVDDLDLHVEDDTRERQRL